VAGDHDAREIRVEVAVEEPIEDVVDHRERAQ
jgi:hypothetical protein